jgi:hypothetical protein
MQNDLVAPRFVSRRLAIAIVPVFAELYFTKVTTPLNGASLERLIGIAEHEFTRRTVRTTVVQEPGLNDPGSRPVERLYLPASARVDTRSLDIKRLQYMLCHKSVNCQRSKLKLVYGCKQRQWFEPERSGHSDAWQTARQHSQ